MLKVITAVFFGTFLYFGLILSHEEWEEFHMMGSAGPPPAIDLNNPLILAALIAGVWVSLVALVRWADRQLEEPVGQKR